MFFQCLQKSQGLLDILFHFLPTITLSDRHDYLPFLVEKMNSQNGYFLNALQLERRGPNLNTDFFIQETFLIYLCYNGVDNRDTKVKRYLIVWKRNKAHTKKICCNVAH